MDRGVEEAFASALGVLAIAGVLFDVGDYSRIENGPTGGNVRRDAIEGYEQLCMSPSCDAAPTMEDRNPYKMTVLNFDRLKPAGDRPKGKARHVSPTLGATSL